MADSQQLQECFVDLALQRTLSGFEEVLKQTMAQFDLVAWACIFPASLQAGGRPLFIAHRIRTTGPLLKRASKEGLASLQFDAQPEGKGGLLDTFARELAPEEASRWQVMRVTREKRVELTLFLYRLPTSADFQPGELEMMGKVGHHLSRCFLLLAKQQEQEFMAGLLRLVSNLYSEGLCVLDGQYRAIFENRNFREHMLLWANGRSALQNLSLPRQTTLPGEWARACDEAFAGFKNVTFEPSQGRLVVTQGPLFKLSQQLAPSEAIEGTVRYLAFQSSLGVRPYLLLISSRQMVRAGVSSSLSGIAQTFKFSRRERQLAELILEGRSAQEIGARLAISIPTVKTHIRSILRKAGVKTRLQFAGLCRPD